MFGSKRTGSTLCPSCGSLVGVNDESCYTCGRRFPAMWGLASLLRGGRLEDLFVPLVLWGCGALYLASLAIDSGGIQMRGLFGMLSPSVPALVRLGGSGEVPVFDLGRWWTVLSAGWLHGGALHIVFNMMAVRNLGPLMVNLHGFARTVVIYTIAGAAGFLASSAAGEYLAFLPNFLQGARLTVGASASVFGMMGALLHYSRRGGSRHLGETVRGWILGGLAFGFFMPGIDNWAHLGGLAGGWLASSWLDPLVPEKGDHMIGAALCLLATVAAIVAAVAVPIPGL
jgi:rhomboid protease GluP